MRIKMSTQLRNTVIRNKALAANEDALESPAHSPVATPETNVTLT